MADKRKNQGIPTAEEEALEAPEIDPVFFAALGAGELGPTAALRQLAGQVIQNKMFEKLPEAVNRLSQYAPQPSNKTMNKAGELADIIGGRINSVDMPNPSRYGEVVRGAFPDSKLAGGAAKVLDKIGATPSGVKGETSLEDLLGALGLLE